MSPCPDVYMGWCNSQPSYEDYYFQGEEISAVRTLPGIPNSVVNTIENYCNQ